jgi:thymidylate synthase
MNNLDKQYTVLLQDILDNGVTKQDRTGTGTLSVFGRQIRHKMSEGFPLLTTKKIRFKSVVTELLWFLRGDTSIEYLLKNDCNIWTGDAYKNWVNQFNISTDEIDEEFINGTHGHDASTNPPSKTYKRGAINCFLEGKRDKPDFFLTQEEFINKIKTDDEFAKKWGELGPVYGKQWRGWGKKTVIAFGVENWIKGVDQITNLINDLKTNPDSRRLMVNAWNVGELDSMVLPPCHYGFQVYTRELSLEERREIFIKQINGLHFQIFSLEGEEGIHREYDKQNVPRRAISLMWNQRSVDTFLGLPFNIASYGLLLEIIAKEVNMVPDELIGNLGDTHLYLNHIEQAKEQIGREFTEEEIQKHLQESGMDALKYEPRMEYISKLPKRTREPYPLPTLNQFPNYEGTRPSIESYVISDFTLKDYQSHPPIKAPLSN